MDKVYECQICKVSWIDVRVKANSKEEALEKIENMQDLIEEEVVKEEFDQITYGPVEV